MKTHGILLISDLFFLFNVMLHMFWGSFPFHFDLIDNNYLGIIRSLADSSAHQCVMWSTSLPRHLGADQDVFSRKEQTCFSSDGSQSRDILCLLTRDQDRGPPGVGSRGGRVSKVPAVLPLSVPPGSAASGSCSGFETVRAFLSVTCR